MKVQTCALLLAYAGLSIFDSVEASSLPLVNLGYQLQQASSYNASGQVYNFSNIRYARPPVGNLRWALPIAPIAINNTNSTIDNGTTIRRVCPQANPAWNAIGTLFLESYVFGQQSSFNYTQALEEVTAAAAATNATDPTVGVTEDCLFLDVFAPKAALEAAQNSSTKPLLPVLVWIHGGGYTTGSKSSSGNPAGLINASQVNGSSGVVFVSINYRLGAFGWLSGPTFSQSGIQNAGLYDQRMALKWVQKYIRLFGGDPSRVTVMGESAGAGSIFHQITAFGGQRSAPFQQAVLQSPAWFPITSSWKQETIFQRFLSLSNVTSLAEARNASSRALITANAYQVTNDASYGSYVYGPTVGGPLVPELPGKLLLEGTFVKNLSIMVGHNSHEGVYFTDPRVQNNDTAYTALLKTVFPGIQDSIIGYLKDDLYPANYSGSQPYTTSIDRTILSVSEVNFACNTQYLDRAFNNNSYAYEFSVFPGVHGQDIGYTWWDGESTTFGLPINATVARVLQEMVTSFAVSGVPKSAKLGPSFSFTKYGSNSQELDLDTSGIKLQTDDTANARCAWWQKALWY